MLDRISNGTGAAHVAPDLDDEPFDFEGAYREADCEMVLARQHMRTLELLMQMAAGLTGAARFAVMQSVEFTAEQMLHHTDTAQSWAHDAYVASLRGGSRQWLTEARPTTPGRRMW